MPKPKTEKHYLPKVNGDGKITYRIVFEGQLDWNDTMAGEHSDFDGLVPVLLKQYESAATFKDKLFKYIANHVYSRCDSWFDNAKIVSFNVPAECEEAFKQLADSYNKQKKEKEMEQLKRLEADAARLRTKLLGK